MMNSKYIMILLGIILVLLGLNIFTHQVIYSPKEHFYIDFAGMHFVIGGIFIVFGAVVIFSVLRKKR